MSVSEAEKKVEKKRFFFVRKMLFVVPNLLHLKICLQQ